MDPGHSFTGLSSPDSQDSMQGVSHWPSRGPLPVDELQGREMRDIYPPWTSVGGGTVSLTVAVLSDELMWVSWLPQMFSQQLASRTQSPLLGSF